MWKTISHKCVHPLRRVELAYSYNEWGFYVFYSLLQYFTVYYDY